MTINVLVKCPEGIVLGADSLVSLTVRGEESSKKEEVAALITDVRKIFQIGRLPVGVLLNGVTAVQGQTVEDILAEYAEKLSPDIKDGPFKLGDVAQGLGQFVQTKFSAESTSSLQLILGGFSRGRTDCRYGEAYTIDWPGGRCQEQYPGDRAFGVILGGHPDPIYRFLFGFDRLAIDRVLRGDPPGTGNQGWSDVFTQVRDYIVQAIEERSGAVPDSVKEMRPPGMARVLPWRMLSSYDPAKESPPAGDNADAVYDAMLRRVVDGGRGRYQVNYGYFSLAMAVNFTWHLLQMAYMESNFTARLPVVGSQLRIAVVTRDEGFRSIWRGPAGLPVEL